jgi:hypothetical protein
MALLHLGDQIRIAFGPDTDHDTTDRLARFALAAVDGAFVAQQADPNVSLRAILADLPTALVAIRRRLTKQRN